MIRGGGIGFSILIDRMLHSYTSTHTTEYINIIYTVSQQPVTHVMYSISTKIRHSFFNFQGFILLRI